MNEENEHRVTDGAIDNRPWRVGGAVTRPEKISGELPKYTELARRTHVHGVVIVEVIIDEEDRVVDERILQPLPMGLDGAALEAVRTWRFRPATFQGKPVKVFYTLEVHFQT